MIGTFKVIICIFFLYVCSINAGNVFFRYRTNYLHVFENSDTKQGLIVEYDEHLAALLDGNSGTGVLINIELKRIYTLKNAWSYSDHYFYNYVKSLKSLKDIYEEIKDNGRTLFPRVFDHTYSNALKILRNLVSWPQSMHHFVYDLNSLIDMNTGIVQHLYPGYHYYYINLFFNDIVNYERSLVQILQGIDGGLPQLAKTNKTSINMYNIFNSSSPGVAVLSYFNSLAATCYLFDFPVFNNNLQMLKVFTYVNGQRDLIRIIAIICGDRNRLLKSFQRGTDELKKLLDEIYQRQAKYGDFKQFLENKCLKLTKNDIIGITKFRFNANASDGIGLGNSQ